MRYFIALLAAVGLLVSVLSLRVHYSHEEQFCDINAHWDCGVVNHSRYAEIKGIPVAVLGIAGYAAIVLLGLTTRRRLVVLAALIGLGFALYLSHIEADVLQVWCLYCVVSQIMIALIFTAGVVDLVRSKLPAKQRS
jgi:vitamin-K-epoxide reductase (warfarin-sensitive)